MYDAHKFIKLSITTPDGELLDSFYVADWRVEHFDGLEQYGQNPDDVDAESVHSRASEALLTERIRRYVLRQAEDNQEPASK
jgi:hypothetical protein